MVDAHSNVEFIGEIGECDKEALLGGAAALLFPVDWPEPFGLVMIEAMACDTPILLFGADRSRKLLKGASGLILDTIEEALPAVRRIASLDRVEVRAEFEHQFTAERMARNYVKIYRELTSAYAARDRTPMRKGYGIQCGASDGAMTSSGRTKRFSRKQV